MESSSPSSAGKMMPSGGKGGKGSKGGKGGKPSSMSGLVRTNLSQQVALQQQHPAYYNGGKGNPGGGNSGYPMMMTHPPPASQQWISSQQQPQQQQIRYAAHGGKPMAYGQQRMPYGGDSYMMRQQTPQVPSSSSASSSPYPYASSIGKLVKRKRSLNRDLFYFSSTRLCTSPTNGYQFIKYSTSWSTNVAATTNAATT
jgi:hypothetical protein